MVEVLNHAGPLTRHRLAKTTVSLYCSLSFMYVGRLGSARSRGGVRFVSFRSSETTFFRFLRSVPRMGHLSSCIRGGG